MQSIIMMIGYLLLLETTASLPLQTPIIGIYTQDGSYTGS
jgi:hypothetical protein